MRAFRPLAILGLTIGVAVLMNQATTPTVFAQATKFCVRGNSNGTDWSTRVVGDASNGHIDVPTLNVGVGLVNGSSAAQMVERFVASLNDAFRTTRINAAAQVDPNDPNCFTITGLANLQLFVSSPSSPNVPDQEVTNHPGGRQFNPTIEEVAAGMLPSGRDQMWMLIGLGLVLVILVALVISQRRKRDTVP